MEIFPASSQRQMDFIRRVIDRCDYYILIVGGRYGSVDEEGVSFTELEFKYAKSKGLPVLAFVRSNIEALPDSQRDSDPALLESLASFRDRITAGTMVDFWTDPNELATKALAALSQARQSDPGVGWLRADVAASTDILNEINQLRKENESLKIEVSKVVPKEHPAFQNLAGMDDRFVVNFDHKKFQYATSQKEKMPIKWIDIFRTISPKFRTFANTTGVQDALSRYIIENNGFVGEKDDVKIKFEDKERILIHFEAKGLVRSSIFNLKNGGTAVFHQLTEEGYNLMLKLNAAYRAT